MNQENIKLQYNQIGKDYIEGQRSYFSNKKDWTRLFAATHLEDISGKRILDIGCGGGSDMELFQKQGAEVFGIDPSEVMINAAQQIFDKQHVKIGDYENIPFTENSFDVVFGRFSLHYLTNFDRAYREMNRVLVQSGALIQIVSHPSFDLVYRLENGHDKQGVITVHLYDNKIPISYPPHTISDYFSSVFFELFDLKAVDEQIEEELLEGKPDIPSALSFYAISR